MRLGSLFDGSGGFPLAGCLCGIEPVWASEIEPYPIAVTRSRFHNMKHLGDISKMNGYTIEPVDVITFGSPCQDLSVAGKRAGLKHTENGDEETTRSGLFMEAVRIIKEMRRATNGRYPSFALWENVPGAFSSNKGEDFRTVLEELIKIVEPKAVMPPVPQGGWPYADSYCGDGWSLAYRVFDAQYWGVPQRRRRIHLVLNLRGDRAQDVLFERESLRGYFAESRTPRKRTADIAENSIAADDRVVGDGCVGLDGYNGDITGDVSSTLGVNCGMSTGRNGVIECRGRQMDAVGCGHYNLAVSGDKAVSLTANTGTSCTHSGPTVAIPYTLKIRSGCEGGGSTRNGDGAGNGLGVGHEGDPAYTVTTGDKHAVAYRQGAFADYVEGELGTLKASGGDLGGGSENLLVEQIPRYIVRRLTPTECARLQGFPDAWGHPDRKDDFTEEEVMFWNEVRNTHAAINGKPTKDYTKAQLLTWYNKLHTDSAEYKMWGNGIALPPALYVMQGIKDAWAAANET